MLRPIEWAHADQHGQLDPDQQMKGVQPFNCFVSRLFDSTLTKLVGKMMSCNGFILGPDR
jgi:hypothetical protein